VDDLETGAYAAFEDSSNGLATFLDRCLLFEDRDKRVMRIACDQKTIVLV
jgi:hypothetical protein